MSVLENLRNLPKEKFQGNLNKFNIESTGNIERDIFNLKNFYFENIETLYNYLPIHTYEYLEVALKEDSEKIFEDDFKHVCFAFENLGLSNADISDITKDTISFINKYSEENNLQNYPKEKFEKIIDEALEKNGFPTENDFNNKYFEAVDKEIGTVLFKFLNENGELREKESYILKLINGIIEVHGYLDIDQIFQIFQKLQIGLSYNQIKIFITFKVPNILFDSDEILVVHDKYFNNYFKGKFAKKKVGEIHSLEAYLQA